MASRIVEEAGDKVTGLDGTPFHFDHPYSNVPIVMSNGMCHDDLLALLN